MRDHGALAERPECIALCRGTCAAAANSVTTVKRVSRSDCDMCRRKFPNAPYELNGAFGTWALRRWASSSRLVSRAFFDWATSDPVYAHSTSATALVHKLGVPGSARVTGPCVWDSGWDESVAPVLDVVLVVPSTWSGWSELPRHVDGVNVEWHVVTRPFQFLPSLDVEDGTLYCSADVARRVVHTPGPVVGVDAAHRTELDEYVELEVWSDWRRADRRRAAGV